MLYNNYKKFSPKSEDKNHSEMNFGRPSFSLEIRNNNKDCFRRS